jgi:signal peptidase
MKLKQKQRKQLIEVLTIIVMLAATIGTYLGLKFFLNTDQPLVVVASGSMHPALETGDLVIVQGVNATEINKNDIIVFDTTEDNDTTRTVHRVINIQIMPNGTHIFTTKGDNNTNPDSTPVSENQVHGRVVYRIPLIGYLALDPTIPLAIVIIALIAILIWPEKHRKKRHLYHSKSKPKIRLTIIDQNTTYQHIIETK